MPRILLLPLIPALAALAFRAAPARGLAVGPLELTPATFCALLAGLVALGVILPRRRDWAGRLLAWEGEEVRPTKGFRVALGGLLLGGAVLRLAHLGEYPLNGDEHLFVNSAHTDGWRAVWSGVMEHLHPPANFYLLHLLQGISVEPVWLRVPSLVAGVATIWLSARLAWELGGRIEALAVALLVACSPALVELSRVCRNYAPAFALLVAALLFASRYLRTGRVRDLAWFSLFEAVALTWLYTLVIPFLAVNMVLFGRLLFQRRPLRDYFPLLAPQLPVAALMAGLYFFHIRVVSSGGMSALYAEKMIDRVMRSPADYLLYLPLPALLLCQYLLAGVAGLFMSVLAVVGACQLWVSGRRWQLVLCLLPFPLSYAFGFAGFLPLGGNRQSGYLFPFVFVLVAASIPAMLTGLTAIRRMLGSARREPSGNAAPRASGGGLVVLVSVFALFLYLSMGIQEGTVFLDRQVELPTSYEELDRALDLLEQSVGPKDLVLVSFQGMVAYHAFVYRAAMPYRPADNFSFNVRGLRFHYSTEAGWFFSPESLIRAYADVRIREGLDEVERVWTVRGAGSPWEEAPRDWFNHDFPDVPKDDRIFLDSNGWLFNVRAEELTRLIPRVAGDPDFYRSDFTRTQFPPGAHHPPEYFLQLVDRAGEANLQLRARTAADQPASARTP